jgi:hypothetical protein
MTDNKISFFAGYIFTAATSVNLLGFFNAAIIGLIGGFFGLLGKEVYLYFGLPTTKTKIRSIKNEIKLIRARKNKKG